MCMSAQYVQYMLVVVVNSDQFQILQLRVAHSYSSHLFLCALVYTCAYFLHVAIYMYMYTVLHTNLHCTCTQTMSLY